MLYKLSIDFSKFKNRLQVATTTDHIIMETSNDLF